MYLPMQAVIRVCSRLMVAGKDERGLFGKIPQIILIELGDGLGMRSHGLLPLLLVGVTRLDRL